MFEQFWSLCIRKMAKKDAEKAFSKLTPEKRLKAIEAMPKHVEYWQAAGTDKEFIPYPASWLRAERWEDEIELPQPKTVEKAWWTSDAGILEYGRQKGQPPKIGEKMHEYKQRLTTLSRVS